MLMQGLCCEKDGSACLIDDSGFIKERIYNRGNHHANRCFDSGRGALFRVGVGDGMDVDQG